MSEMGVASAQSLLSTRSLARTHVHCAEMALHDAEQSHVDSWVRAAADRLHDAILELLAADSALGLPWAVG